MKKILFFFCFIIAAGCTNAQNPPAAIPPYRILTTDSVYVTPANLKKNVPTMIIYFAPDCPHCQALTREMKAHMKAFKHLQIMMITFAEPLKASQVFYRDYSLAKYPNITVGTEGHTYTLVKYYMIQTTPYIAIYDKNGKLFKAYPKSPDIEELVATVKKV